jgi:two-component system, NtrC family, nitrogen regulation sensor histidine kinase NtrY
LQIKFIRNSFLKDNSYLLFASVLLLFISVFTQRTDTRNFFSRSYTKHLQTYISNAETNFNSFTVDTALINSFANGTIDEVQVNKITQESQYFYLYKHSNGLSRLAFWNTQTVFPDSSIVQLPDTAGFTTLTNGYYFFQKKRVDTIDVISLLPIKWNYIVANDYLKNEFVTDASVGSKFDISTERTATSIFAKDGALLFSLKPKETANIGGENKLTIWLRILSFLPLFLFIHFTAAHIFAKRGIFLASVFLASTLIVIRLFTYFFYVDLNFRQFELFDPSVYGSNIILRSLGDLLINALLFLWVINFIRNNLKENQPNLKVKSIFKKWLVLAAVVLIVLAGTYISGSIIRSMVADSQISFDVMNFFSLNSYSVIGFLVLCCITIAYYYFCSAAFLFVKNLFNQAVIPFFLLTTITGLLLLSFMIGNLTNGFELYELVWLLFFLLLLKIDLSGVSSLSLIVSRMVFWLFFFSATIAAVIISENSTKEFRNRRHYAEVLAAKTNPISDVLLNTILTEFRPEVMANKFYLFKNANTSARLRDSLVSNNFNSYTDNFETKVLVYDSAENPLHNQDPVSYNSINSILNTQAKPTAIPSMFYYDTDYDKFNYISRRVIKDTSNNLLGYLFIVVSPKNFLAETLYPELFSRGQNNSIENSAEYAFAIYDQGKLISSHNDYAFSTRYSERYFAGKQFLLEKNKKFNELWYNAGGNKFVLIVKENKLIIESIALFSFLFCTFILLNALSSFISLLLKSRFSFRKIKNAIQLTIRQQVHGTIIFFSVLSFLVIGIATILFFITRYQNNNKEILSRTIKIIGTDLSASVTKQMVEKAVFDNKNTNQSDSLEKIIERLSKVHRQEINLYTLGGDLKASSLSLPYMKGIVSTKIDPLAYFHLHGGNEIQYYQKEKIGSLDFVSDYIPVTNKDGEEIAYLNIPYFTSQTNLKEEISSFLVTIIILNAFVLLIAGIVALIITNRITHSFSLISDKMQDINLAQRNEAIEWNKNDEIGALVKEYNKMVAKLNESAATLAKTERENAWQEMAKQVAHEIKNPLTPMKLSMQFLQKAIDEGAPNIKELSTKVSATLVEQIDHLSAIAGEFSRFANIEQANPETFNIGDALNSVKQLYERDTEANFTWRIIPNDVLVYADRTHINRMLTNLILNGIQAVPENKYPHISVYQSVHNNMVEIKIIDNGTGIGDDIKSKIFAPNFTTKTSGTGLGLAMCKRMAEQAGGNIYFETSGEGTTFFVELPIV